jgi:DNA recombination protein RmuC
METIIIILLTILCILAIIILFVCLKNKDSVPEELETRLKTFDSSFNRADAAMRDEFARNREESAKSSRENSDELAKSLKSFEDSIRQRIEEQLKGIREENAKKLEEMRKTVDDNLKDTVEKRFNDSFRLISERLEKVHQGLGEMQQLASGVGDLKRVFTNVKTRGALGEIQLGAILEQMLSPAQYESEATVKQGGSERVDYVIKLPDKNSDDKMLLLPIDSKFPTEDYERLVDAYANPVSDDETKKISAAFETAVKRCAKSINEKYINPPVTTDFAIMFVPTEALYAEIVRRTELFEHLQRMFKVTVVGPTNLAAFLNSLQMGFRTLAIERRSNEVWEILGAVKTEFGKFGTVMDNLKKKLDSAAKEIDTISVRSRAIERKLRTVEELPAEKSSLLIANTTELKELSAEDDDSNL